MLQRICRSLKARSFRTNVSDWHFFDFAGTEEAGATLPEEIEFRVLEGDQRERLHGWLLEHRKAFPWVYFPEEIASARRNDHCYPVLIKDRQIVGFIKLARGRVYIHDFESELRLPEGIAFIYDTFIDPELRGGGLGVSLIRATAAWLRDQGCRGILCHIEDWNRASVRTFSGAGFVRLGAVRYLRVTFFRWWLIDGSLHRVAGLGRWLEGHASATRGHASGQ
jgi:GNAT superfamily N-acetyltransferase